MTTRHVNNPLLKRMHSDYRAKLAAENAHAETLRAQLPGIIARAEALPVIADALARAKVRHIAKVQLPLKGLEAA